MKSVSKADTLPTRGDIAAFRGYLDGIAPQQLVDRYCAQHPLYERGAHAVVASIRRHLVTAARLRQMHEGAQLLSNAKPGKIPAAAVRRLNALLTQLPNTHVPIPTLSDPLEYWLPARSVRSLAAAGVSTLAGVIVRRAHRRMWWRTIPGFGQRAARSVDAFLDAHPHLLEASHRALSMHSSDGVISTDAAVVPREAVKASRELDGSHGKLRAPRRACLLDAHNDYDAVRAWLSLQESVATQRAYRKEAERLMLWAMIEKGKPLSSLTTEDAIAYRRFLRHPTPATRWIGPTAPRQSSEWRPFQGELSVRSTAYALSVLSALYRWLTEQRYLIGNPFAGITAKAMKNAKNSGAGNTEFTEQSERAFIKQEWVLVLQWADRAAKKLGWSIEAAQRLGFVLRFGQATGLRISELAQARVRDIKVQAKTQRWLMANGKGNKRAAVALPPLAWQALMSEMQRRGYGKRWDAWPSALPLIGTFSTNPNNDDHAQEGISPGRLWVIVRKFFDEVAGQLETSRPQLSAKLRAATPHWLRHTHATAALAGGADLTTVRDNLRHSSLTTTSGYLHVDDARRSRQLSRAFGTARVAMRSKTPQKIPRSIPI